MSTDAAYLLALGMNPIDILADKMAIMYEGKTAVTGAPEITTEDGTASSLPSFEKYSACLLTNSSLFNKKYGWLLRLTFALTRSIFAPLNDLTYNIRSVQLDSGNVIMCADYQYHTGIVVYCGVYFYLCLSIRCMSSQLSLEIL